MRRVVIIYGGGIDGRVGGGVGCRGVMVVFVEVVMVVDEELVVMVVVVMG